MSSALLQLTIHSYIDTTATIYATVILYRVHVKTVKKILILVLYNMLSVAVYSALG